MFDGLKEKLGRFKSEAEEVAEENAEVEEEPGEGDEPDESEAVADVEESGGDESVEVEAGVDAGAGVEPEDGIEDDRPPATDAEAVDSAEPADVDADAEGSVATDEPDSGATTDEPDSDGVTTDEPDSDGATTDEPDSGATTDEPESGEASDDSEGADEHPAPEGEESPESADESGESPGSAGFAAKAKSFARGRVVIEEEDLEGPLQDLELALLSSDVEMTVAQEILDTIREDLVGEERKFTESTGEIVEDALRDALLSVISVGQFDFDERIREAEKPVVVIFTGVNGVGKTTSIAKLSEYLADRGLSSVLANGDTYRAGANEQIREHAENLDRELIAHEQGGDPAAVIYDAVEYARANDVDVVLGDTAGRLHTSDDLMSQLEKIDRVVDPDMTLFVDEAVAGQDAVNRAREFDDAAEIDGTILTKADADSQGGAAISIAHVTGKPILFLGTGQGYDDLERFDPEALVADLVGE